MNDLTTKRENLPDNIEDLSRFVLIGREKITAIKAEIRAIEKLKLAKEVRDQKRQEAQMLAEVLLDAEVKLGEFFDKIPKAPGKRADLEPTDSAVGRLESKKEVISSLGFSEKQGERLEMLAENKELVEQVKAEAREKGEFPTRTRVLELAAQKNKQGKPIETRIIRMADYEQQQEDESEEDEYEEYVDLRHNTYKEFMKIIDLIARFEIVPQKMDALRDNFDHVLRIEDHVGYINESIDKLNMVKAEIWKGKRNEK